MRFCTIVGQASIQTARRSGPSTMNRSRGFAGRAEVVTGIIYTATKRLHNLWLSSYIQPVSATYHAGPGSSGFNVYEGD